MALGAGLRVAPVDVALKRVIKRFGNTIAVDDISLTVSSGSYCCLVGPSGCGKTTTLRLIAGHEKIDEGTLSIGSVVVNDLPPSRRGTAMMFQSYALFPHMTALDNVAFPLRARGIGRSERYRRAAEMLALVHMEELQSRHPAALSGGQQQRVALARALVTGPSVLLLDEPLSALDPFLRTRVRRELKRLQRDIGITFIHVTHAQDESLALADLVVVMSGGKIVQAGPPEELYARPSTAFVARLLGGYSVVQGIVLERLGHAAAIGISGQRILVSNVEASVGSTVVVAIRSDSFSLAAIANSRLAMGGLAAVDANWANTTNALTGRVTSVEFGGNVYTIVLTLDGGGEISADLRGDEIQTERLKLGACLTLRWPTAASIPLEAI